MYFEYEKMRNFTYFFNLFVCCGLLFFIPGSTFAQVTVTSSDSLNCGTTCTVLTAHVTGDAPINAGVTSDDIYSPAIPIGFTFNYYGTNYTSCELGANGEVDFNASDAGAYDAWQITGPLLGETTKYNNICGPWCDIDIFYTGTAIGTETYSTDGVAPYRKFAVSWCGCSMYSCGAQRTTTQIILYETTNIIEVHISKKQICAGWNGGYAIVGVQNATGTAATTAPGRDFPSTWAIPPTEGWRFTPAAGGASYTVASIPYAPIPLASSSVYWYNATTGTYMGTGTTMTVCPTSNTTYKAGALGCADTSFGYYTVTTSATGPVVTLTPNNPSLCGTCNGTITLNGLSAGLSDTVNYTYGGVPQPAVVATVTPTGTITLTGLCPGTYNNFVVKQLTCYSLPAGPVTLAYPPISISGVTPTNPSLCGVCDGMLVLNGLYPNQIFTINYNYNGVAQPPLTLTSSATGTVTMSGLCSGAYSNIVASFGTCITPPVGPYTLNDPPISISSITPTNPSLCGVCDGSLVLHGLYPSHAFTITYNFNGIAQTPINTTTNAAGNITISGLCAGAYSNIIASFGSCITPPAGPDTLFNPAISISSVTTTDPTFCGVCDGTMVLHGLYPNHDFVVNYDFNGVAQPAVVTVSSATGTITLTGLCAGTYTNIIASFGVCITPAVGPYTLNNPATPPLTISSFTNPSQCGYCDGSIVIRALTPYFTGTVNYTIGGVPQPPVTAVAQSDSTVHIPGLCIGNYANFTITVGACVYTVNGSANLTTIPVQANFDTLSVHYGCHGDSVYFNNTSTSTPGANIYYVWNFGDGTSDTTLNPMHVYAQGTYTVTLTATNHHCTSDSTIVISLIHPLHASFTEDPTIVCQGFPVTFTNTSVGQSPTYVWNFGNGSTPVTTTNATYSYNNLGQYTVTLVATDWVPCHDTASAIVYVDTLSGVVMNVTDTVICEGSYMTFTGLYSPIGNTGVVWNFGDGDSLTNMNPVAHTYNATGTFTVTVNALYRACSDISTTRNIIVYQQPNINLGPDTSICPGSEALTVGDVNNADPGATWLWNTGQTGRTISITAPGVYYATVSVNNCHSSDTIVVANDCYMSMPNVFTPNGDGVNDYFFPRQLLTAGLTQFHMTIFNRWGQQIFETSTLDGRGWDGKLNDIPQPEGVYVYVIDATFKDGQKEHHQGNVTLLR